LHLELPVAAGAGAAGRVGARRDVRLGQVGDPLDERASARSGGEIAAVEEDVGAPRRAAGGVAFAPSVFGQAVAPICTAPSAPDLK
jgi:hypothetical protein